MTAAGDIVFRRAPGNTWTFQAIRFKVGGEQFSVVSNSGAVTVVRNEFTRLGTFPYWIRTSIGDSPDLEIINKAD